MTRESRKGDPTPRVRVVQSKRAGIHKLLLDAQGTLNTYLRLIGDLTGASKAPQRNPKEVTAELYEEWVNLFLDVFQKIWPECQRQDVVEALANAPQTAGEFLPFVQTELAKGTSH